jgi:hypothetical protein
MLSGCAAFTPSDIAQPSEISIQDAMAAAGEGLVRMNQEVRKAGLKFGLIACETTTVFNIAAGAKDSSKLVMDLKLSPGPGLPTPILTGTAGANTEYVQASDATRGNQITIRMVNVACLPNNVLGHSSPEKTVQLLELLEKAGVSTTDEEEID